MLLDATPLPVGSSLLPEPLCLVALRALRAFFPAIDHHPSQAQWEALIDLLEHMDAMLEGDLDVRGLYLSAIPCGVGKTTAIQAFARAMTADPYYARHGMLIAVNRVQEAEDMARALQDVRARLGIVCGDPAVCALGDHLESSAAQVLIATHEALRVSLRKTGDFARVDRFQFRGRRRPLIVWDEAVALNRPVCLDEDAMTRLATPLRRQSPEAREALLRWALDLARAPAGPCDVPDFRGLGVDFTRLEQDAGDDDAAAARALGVLSGNVGFVHRDNRETSGALVAHTPELPLSLLPMIVTDAGAARGVKHIAYEQMGQDRRYRIHRLQEAPKTYANMTLRLAPIAASRSAYRDPKKAKDLLATLAAYVRSTAPEEVLVVGYKSHLVPNGSRRDTLEDALRARLTPEEQARTHFLHYGAHTSGNGLRNVTRVCLAGLNFLPRAAAYAASGAAQNKPMRSGTATDHPTSAQVEEMRRGMIRDSSLQALLRGSARLSQGGDCRPMEALVLQASQTGLSGTEWEGMFPGVKIVKDATLVAVKPLKGNLKKLAAVVQRRLEAGEVEMTDPSIYAEMDMDRQNYRRLKAKPEWDAWLATMGLHKAKLPGNVLGSRRAG